MLPAVVFPLHDPDGVLFPHLEAITPVLKQNFSSAFLIISGSTQEHFPENISRLKKDVFFKLLFLDGDSPVGDHFASLYRQAALASSSEQVLHLCFIDRLAFALGTEYRARFLADVNSIGSADVPLIFQRSEKAWRTHPRNYYEIESFVTTIGKILFGKPLDYAWCHLVVRASHLTEILSLVRNHDLSMVAEMILLLQSDINRTYARRI
jgi:hypothetical protein